MRDRRQFRPDEQLARWGSRQHRQVTTAQLRAVGWDKHAVERRVAGGRLHPVYDGVYSLGGPPLRDREWWMAAVLRYAPGAVLSHSAAAELYGLLRYPLGAVHVTTLRQRRSRQGIVAHHRSEGFTWRYVDGIPVTGPEQTVLDCATCVLSGKAYRRIIRQAQAEGLTSHVKLEALALSCPGRRGVARLKRELADGPSPTRSAHEDEVLEVFRAGGSPQPNATVHGHEVDLWFPKLGVAVEVQSALHDNPAAREDDLAKKQRLERRGVRVLWVS